MAHRKKSKRSKARTMLRLSRLRAVEERGSSPRMVKKVVRRLHYSEEYCYGYRVGLDWKPLTSRDQYSSCAPRLKIPNRCISWFLSSLLRVAFLFVNCGCPTSRFLCEKSEGATRKPERLATAARHGASIRFIHHCFK
jgi:hypothetical protein